MDTIRIGSAEDLFDFARKAVHNNESFNAEDIVFAGWPNIDFRVRGERYHGTAPISLLRGLVNFQDEIYRTIAEVKFGTRNIGRLKQEEKADLEFVMSISEGCTKGEASADGWLNKAINSLENVMSGMDSNHKAAVICTIALSVAGYLSFDSYMDHKLELEKLSESTAQETIQADSQVATIDAISSLIREPSNATIASEVLLDGVESAYKEILKSAPDATSAMIGERQLTKADIELIISAPEKVKDVVEIQENLTVFAIKHNPEYFLISVTKSDDISFNMRVYKGFATDKEIEYLFNCLKTGQQVNISYQVSTTNSNIDNARLLNIKVPETLVIR